MITKHEYTVVLTSGWRGDQIKGFEEQMIKPFIKECAANWPSVRIIKVKEEKII